MTGGWETNRNFKNNLKPGSNVPLQRGYEFKER